MNKQFAVVIIVIIAALVGIFSMTKNKDGQTGGQNSNGQTQPSEHKVGKGTKGVTLIEYGDFECPACKSYYPFVKQIKQEYGDEITFQFRHFPLTQIHPNAFVASRAAEAAGKQGKFFEMHDVLYENQDAWKVDPNPSGLFEGYAMQLGLDVEQFKNDVKSAETNAVINADLKAGQALGANSTPTFVINGKKVEENPRSVEEFKKLIDAAATQQ